MSRARYLRKNPTRYERTLWRSLRNRKFAGYKFRRQHPLGRYIADFSCRSAKLVIELDGSGHGYVFRQRFDRMRQKSLAKKGITILRFWNRQVHENLDGVLQEIWFALEEHAGRNPAP